MAMARDVPVRQDTNCAATPEHEELLAWDEVHRKEDEVCAEAAAETLRKKLGDESGETDLEQVRLSLEEEENPKKQYTLTEKRHPICCLDRRKRILQRHATGCFGVGGHSLCSKFESKHSFRLESTGRTDKPKSRGGGMCSNPCGPRLQT